MITDVFVSIVKDEDEIQTFTLYWTGSQVQYPNRRYTYIQYNINVFNKQTMFVSYK
jgi:hypothetical protein